MKKIFLFTICFLFLIFAFRFYSFEKAINTPLDPKSSQKVIFEIKPGSSAKLIATNLEKEGLVKDKSLVLTYLKFRGSPLLKAGIYQLSKDMSLKEIIDILIKGAMIERWITIPEGWRLDQIASYLEQENIVKKEEFLQKAKVIYFKKDYPFLKGLKNTSSLEGYLFPDTYRIFVNSSPEEIIRKFLENFENKIAKFETELKNSEFTLHQIITLASIIERETRTPEDRRIVSGIFQKRLKLNKPLESCATIAYIKKQDKYRFSFEDTRINSPYNTYINFGLPPGPICNPGLDSIEAVFYPKETDYLYFMSPPDGSIIYAKTYQEQLENMRRYFK